MALDIAFKALGLGNGDEVIVTSRSYIASVTSIINSNATPVFVDIDPEYWTIDENKIENAITEKTTCILATHVFGNPCNIKVIEKIAKQYNLKVNFTGQAWHRQRSG